MSAKKYFSFAIKYFPALWQSLNTWVGLGKMLETKMSISSCKMAHYGNMTKYHDKLALWHHDIVTISMDRQIFCLYLMKLESNVHFAIVHIQTKCLFWKYLTTHTHWLLTALCWVNKMKLFHKKALFVSSLGVSLGSAALSRYWRKNVNFEDGDVKEHLSFPWHLFWLGSWISLRADTYFPSS